MLSEGENHPINFCHTGVSELYDEINDFLSLSSSSCSSICINIILSFEVFLLNLKVVGFVDSLECW